VFDIESKEGPSRIVPGFTRPFMAGVYDGSRYFEFRDMYPGRGGWEYRFFFEGGCIDQTMRLLLANRYAGRHIYAHNAGRFDFLFLLPWLMQYGESLGYCFSIIPVASAIQVLDVWHRSKPETLRWRFLDSVKLIPTSLDKAAKSFGLSGKLEHDLGLHENDPSWSAYLKEDCLQLYGVLEKFHDYVENVLCGEVGVTAPSTSIKLFRRKYLKKSYPRSEETHDFVRQGYFGGRVEVFRKEGFNLRYYDINSSYPAAMLQTMPAGRATQWSGQPPKALRDSHIGFVRVNVNVPEDIAIPPLPVRCGDELKHAKGKLIFPVGRLSGVWEWQELERAMELGVTIERWYDSVWYKPVYLFKDFVNDLYKYRDRSRPGYDVGLDNVVKIMLNSSYGKFGMKTLRKQIYHWNDPNLPIDAKPANGDPECPIWYAEKTVDAPYIMPQISARVTALARVRLLNAMLEAKSKGGEVYYCDTDSVITDVELETSTALGALKDEYPEQSGKLHGLFAGPKLYLLTAPGDFEKIKAKGVEKRTMEVFQQLSRGEVIIQRRLEKVGGMARRGFDTGPKMMTVPRRILPDRGKREMLEDGSTRPWRLDMW
jgi:hypothetical protein